MKSESVLGKMIEDRLSEGAIVPAEITISLLKKQLLVPSEKTELVLIDGFPRNLDNLHGWNKEIGEDKVICCIYLDCPREQLFQRLMYRGQFSGRSDDNVRSIEKRFETFQTMMPVLEHYEFMGLLKKVDGSRSQDEVFDELSKLLFQKETSKDP